MGNLDEGDPEFAEHFARLRASDMVDGPFRVEPGAYALIF